ncbi:unknown [Fusobacterium sp. CAG:439]|nr:unknown [Fusobacterium sp. CAG:439]
MGQTILKKKTDGIEIEISFDDESYSQEEARTMIAEFIYMLTSNS